MTEDDKASTAKEVGAIRIETASSRMLELVEFGTFAEDAAELLSKAEHEEMLTDDPSTAR